MHAAEDSAFNNATYWGRNTSAEAKKFIQKMNALQGRKEKGCLLAGLLICCTKLQPQLQLQHYEGVLKTPAAWCYFFGLTESHAFTNLSTFSLIMSRMA